ncbi:gamma-glutamylcyclotransferase family protein [Radicibacter daui]|uniref:gamma-glutamylcyclotransferase family protein n=1 Tax=Radicibacter daui TaxID=3064829 RepID=UPI004046AA56
MLYFAYGSNLDPEQMLARCPGHEFVAVAGLADHRLTFPRFSTGRRCGVAGIEPEAGANVWGVIYRLTTENHAALRGFEGYDPGRPAAENHYGETRLTLTGRGGERYEDVLSYIATPMAGGPFLPDAAYHGHILRGARHWQLPAAWIVFLEAIEPLEAVAASPA